MKLKQRFIYILISLQLTAAQREIKQREALFAAFAIKHAAARFIAGFGLNDRHHHAIALHAETLHHGVGDFAQ